MIILKAPAVVLSLNASSVDGFISNCFKTFPKEPIVGVLVRLLALERMNVGHLVLNVIVSIIW